MSVMMKPRVTIGICVRNCEDFIGEAINSVANQDFSHESMETIIVDDGSQDKTLSVISRYKSKMDMQVKIFRQEWKGLGSARNIVVDNASGEYIIWVDGDMLLSTDYVSKQVKFMEQNHKVGIAKGRYDLSPGANLLATLEIYSRAASKMVNFNYNDKAHAKSMGTGGCIYRVKAIRQVGGFDEKISGYGEDLDAEYRIRKAGWLFFITDAQFRDYERRGMTWKQLWARYLQRGFDMCYFSRKNKNMITLYKTSPVATFFAGFFHSLKIYRLTRHKVAFLLPIQYMVKSTAWFLGFIRGRIIRLEGKETRQSDL